MKLAEAESRPEVEPKTAATRATPVLWGSGCRDMDTVQNAILNVAQMHGICGLRHCGWPLTLVDYIT
jgi:hypothetical protein